MEPSIKDKHIILGFIGVAICLISFFLTLVVAESFNQDNFVRLIVFVCSNLLGWLLYFSFQAFIFDSYQIYKIKFGKEETKETPAEIVTVQEAEPQDKIAPVAPTTEEASPDIKPMELAIDPKLHEANRASYKDRQEQEKEERVRMVMEYIHFIMPRIADEETVNHICNEVGNWMNLNTYKPKPITGRLPQEITNYPAPSFRMEHIGAFHV